MANMRCKLEATRGTVGRAKVKIKYLLIPGQPGIILGFSLN